MPSHLYPMIADNIGIMRKASAANCQATVRHPYATCIHMPKAWVALERQLACTLLSARKKALQHLHLPQGEWQHNRCTDASWEVSQLMLHMERRVKLENVE